MLDNFSEFLRSTGKSENTALSYCEKVQLYLRWCADSFGSEPKQLYREGDPVGGGYVVRKIEKDQAVLMRGSEKTVLLLHKKQEKKP